VVWYGHFDDGNLHLNILKPEALPVDQFQIKCVNVSKQIGQHLAEQGVGLLNKNYLHYSRSPQQLAMMRSIKQAFDPKHILNPGKVFD
jgi:FAD/FMN-containing dehydrogenase